MAVIDKVRDLAEPIAAELGVSLYDIEQNGGIVRVTIDRPGGVSVDDITRATRALNRALDESDPVPGHYTLEVSSPGLERTLRTPAHFLGAIGTTVTVKTRPQVEGDRRLTGVLTAADDDGFTLALSEPIGSACQLAYTDIDKARTVFEWGPAPKPGSSKKGAGARAAAPSPTSDPDSAAGDEPTTHVEVES